MEDVFIRKYWDEDGGIMFYIHFQDGQATEQVEVTSMGEVFLNLQHPIAGESMLCDQALEGLDLEKNDFITRDEFDKIWNSRNRKHSNNRD